ncbi:MAG: polymer-forming cytoskeletal protein [Pseudomonadota bacterium]
MAGFGKQRARDKARGPMTLIAEGCTLTGQITGDNDILLSGVVDGDSILKGMVTITREGHWKGTLTARDVIVSGTVDGDINASGCIEIASTARIRGTVTGDQIAVASGAVIDGQMRITGNRGDAHEFTEKRESEIGLIAAKKAS